MATLATQPPQGASDDSVRITAQQRRQTEIDFLVRELARQQVIASSEAADLKRLKELGLRFDQAERRAANATAVLQYLGSTLRAYGYNRDFPAVTG